jgi:hypothetical protein
MRKRLRKLKNIEKYINVNGLTVNVIFLDSHPVVSAATVRSAGIVFG